MVGRLSGRRVSVGRGACAGGVCCGGGVDGVCWVGRGAGVEPSAAARTSLAVTRPPMPEPTTVSMATERSRARRRTAGAARALPSVVVMPGV